MKRPLWFKAKRYGWGWYPATWQGWLILLVFVVLIVEDFYRIDSGSDSSLETLISWVPDTIILAIVVSVIAWLTGEPPRWRWGKD